MSPPQGVILINLGSPDAPEPQAVRRYLAEFLSDRRVVDLPPWLWQPILRGIVLRRRPPRSARRYAAIWSAEGSPLVAWTRAQAEDVRERLAGGPERVEVRYAMRYGHPRLHEALDDLAACGCSRILLAPLYPQYSGSTTASTLEHAEAWAQTWARTGAHTYQQVPALPALESFSTAPQYIDALAARVEDHWQRHGHGELLVLSFHGLPQRMVDRGDPYAAQCVATAEALAQRLQLAPQQWRLAYQSRFGFARWLEPALDRVLDESLASGTRQLDLLCPGFVSDCLETLEEIGIEASARVAARGGELRCIPCLNDHPAWLDGLATLLQQRLDAAPEDA